MKKTNKGFSLVELIIVIAIMAILAGAIAPALIRYIDKSRKSNDVSSCKTIKTAVETALGNEDIYEYLVNNMAGATVTIEVIPNRTTMSATAGAVVGSQASGKEALKINGLTKENPADLNLNISQDDVIAEIGTNIGEKTPKLKYKKEIKKEKSGLDSNVTPESFYVVINKKGTVYVGIGAKGATSVTVDSSKGTLKEIIEVAPDVNKVYQ